MLRNGEVLDKSRKERHISLCPVCQASTLCDVYVIVDESRRDLIAEIETLHEIACGSCGERCRVDSGYMIYSPNGFPGAVYFCAEHTSDADDEADKRRVAAMLGLVDADEILTFPQSKAPVHLGLRGDTAGSFVPKAETEVRSDRLRDLIMESSRLGDEGDVTHDPAAAARRLELSEQAWALLDGTEPPTVAPLIRLYIATGLLGSLADGTAAKGSIMLRMERAIGELSRAVRDLEGGLDDDLLARVHLELARAYSKRGWGRTDLNERLTIDHGRAAIDLANPEDDLRLWAAVRSNLACAYMNGLTGPRSERMEQALDLLSGTSAKLGQMHGSLTWCDVMSNLGQAYAMRAEGDPAVNFARAADCYEAVAAAESFEANPRGWGDTQYKLGALRLKQDDPHGALRHLEQACEAYLRAGTGQLSSARMAMANAYAMLGDHERQVELLAAEAERYSPELEPVMWARRQTQLALALDAHEPGRARDILTAVAAAQATSDEDRSFMDRALTLRALGDLHMSRFGGGDAAALMDAIRCFEETAELTVGEPEQAAMDGARLGGAYAWAERWADAAQAYSRAVAACEARYRMLVVRHSREDQLAVAGAIRHRAAYALARAGRFEDALLMLELARARLLGEALERDHADLDLVARLDPGAHAMFTDAAEHARAVENNSRRIHAGDASPEDDRRLAEESLAAQEALADAVRRVRAVEGMSGFLAMPELGDIQPVQGRPLVYLAATTWGTVVLVAAWDGALSVTASFTEEVTRDRLSSLFGLSSGGAVQADLVDAVTQVGGELAEAITAALPPGTTAMTLVPCGLLALLPLHAAGKAAGDALADTFEINYAFSGRALIAEGADRGLEPLLAVGDPTGNLPQAGDEVAVISASFTRTSRLVGPEATLENVRDALASAGCLHFACHGLYAKDPLASGLELNDGRLTVGELLSTHPPLLRGARLVVLSACESAVVDPNAPDEVIGLPAAITYAGAPAVVGSLWKVGDIAANVFMTRFYRLLCASVTPADALTRTQRWMRTVTAGELLAADGRSSPELRSWLRLHDEDEPPFASARDWAPFILVGA